MVRQNQLYSLSHQQPIQGHYNPKNQLIASKETYKKSIKRNFQDCAMRNGRSFIENSKHSTSLNNKISQNTGNTNAIKTFYRHHLNESNDLKLVRPYAEPNFFVSPSPSSVPLPPLHWREKDLVVFNPSLQCMTLIIKGMLQVQ